MRVLIILSLLALALVLAFYPKRLKPELTGPIQDAPQIDATRTARANTPVRHPPAASTTVTEVVFAPKPVPQVSDHLFDRKRYYTDTNYQAKIQKHMAIKRYEQSPARETDEAYAILDLLAKEGLERAAVPDAYNLAYEANKIISMVEQQHGLTPEQAKDQITLLMLGIPAQLEERFVRNFPLTNPPAFYAKLYQIRPTNFFGQKDLNLPADGELLLE